MCDGRHWFAFSLASCVVRVGKRGLAGLWGHERGRVQAAPKHGVHGLAQGSNPYGKHPFQDMRRPAAGVARMRRWLRETRPRQTGGRRRGRTPGTGLLRQPEARRRIGIRPSGVPRDGAQPHWGVVSGAAPDGPAVRVKGGAHNRANSDARAGRDCMRGFVNTT
jgi:hypothetical protein